MKMFLGEEKEVDMFVWQFRQNIDPFCPKNSERKADSERWKDGGKILKEREGGICLRCFQVIYRRSEKDRKKFKEMLKMGSDLWITPECPPDLEQPWAEQFCWLQRGERRVKRLENDNLCQFHL